jgi:Flp pilus assembly protein TadG
MQRLSRKKRFCSQPRRGATLVEFALVAPIFFLLLLASFEFSRLNVIRHTADNAAYEAARMIMVPGAKASEGIAEAERILRIVGARGTTVTVDPSELGPRATQVTVEVAVPMNSNGLITPVFTGSAVVRSKSTLKAERIDP